MTVNQKYLIAGIVVVVGGIIIYSIDNKASGKSPFQSLIPETDEHKALQYEIDWISGWNNGLPVNNDWHQGIFDNNKNAFLHGSYLWNEKDKVTPNPYGDNEYVGISFRKHILDQAKLYAGGGKYKNTKLTINDFNWLYFWKTWNGENPYIKQNHNSVSLEDKINMNNGQVIQNDTTSFIAQLGSIGSDISEAGFRLFSIFEKK